MARRVFFSFHYDDIMNANIVRNSGQFKPTSETGFYDKSLWEEAEIKGKAALRKLIDAGMNNTSVTCFLIGKKTYERPWCKYELAKSIEDGKGILGILLPNQMEHGPNGLVSTARYIAGTTTNFRNGLSRQQGMPAGRW